MGDRFPDFEPEPEQSRLTPYGIDARSSLTGHWETPTMAAMKTLAPVICYLLLKKHRTRKQCAILIPKLLSAVDQLRQARLPQLVQLGETLDSWKQEIATMWRFTRNNGITEGFHNKMETISRQAYGFRNFENYRLRVKVLCG
jgi:hypothetical protein